MKLAIQAKNLARVFSTPQGQLHILSDINLGIGAGESVAVVGPSGSGKSTLLHLLAGLDQPSAGEVFWGDMSVGQLDAEAAARARQGRVGLVFQRHHLLPELTVLENVTLPGRVQGKPDVEAALALLTGLGMQDRLDAFPTTLSGGEALRVAIARAMVGSPQILLADEPTGHLDRVQADAVMDALLALTKAHGAALLFVTHDERMASLAQRRYELSSGSLQRLD